ncbi:2-hydroxyacid dehydrogenase [Herbaspirillum sp. NPDC087042]|uniref:2-hydroxyacid dehydrogenase n=1 Tax=Herbaspirillum sp. NPDC087042 TaxID=3364004 RepID=UPI0038042D38
MKPSIAITRATFPDVLERLRAQFDVLDNQHDVLWSQAELIARLQGKTCAITHGSDRIDAVLLDACPQLRAVCNVGVGYNNIDVEACTARGVLVTNTPDVLTETTADFGFALLMATARRIAESDRYVRARQWNKTGIYDMLLGGDIHGATLGIFGMGRIGQAIARRGAHGFNMRVVYHNRSRLDPAIEAECRASYVDKETLFAQADHLIVVVPYSPSSHHAIGAAELRLMKPSATLVNIARGGVIDDGALATALREGVIAAAGLDVFEGEPNVRPELLDIDNVVLTPHIGSASVQTRKAMALLAVRNLEAVCAAVHPVAPAAPTPVNPQLLNEPARLRA